MELPQDPGVREAGQISQAVEHWYDNLEPNPENEGWEFEGPI